MTTRYDFSVVVFPDGEYQKALGDVLMDDPEWTAPTPMAEAHSRKTRLAVAHVLRALADQFEKEARR